jgi:hypothetical protein
MPGDDSPAGSWEKQLAAKAAIACECSRHRLVHRTKILYCRGASRKTVDRIAISCSLAGVDQAAISLPIPVLGSATARTSAWHRVVYRNLGGQTRSSRTSGCPFSGACDPAFADSSQPDIQRRMSPQLLAVKPQSMVGSAHDGFFPRGKVRRTILFGRTSNRSTGDTGRSPRLRLVRSQAGISDST